MSKPRYTVSKISKSIQSIQSVSQHNQSVSFFSETSLSIGTSREISQSLKTSLSTFKISTKIQSIPPINTVPLAVNLSISTVPADTAIVINTRKLLLSATLTDYIEQRTFWTNRQSYFQSSSKFFVIDSFSYFFPSSYTYSNRFPSATCVEKID